LLLIGCGNDGELAAGAGDHERERSLRFDRRWGEPVETDPAALVESLILAIEGQRWGCCLAWGGLKIAGSADAAGHHSGEAGDPPEYPVLQFALEWE